MKRKRWRPAALLFCLLLFFGTLPAVPSFGDAVTDTITISVGYFGWTEDQYVEKVTYHWTELDDLYGGVLPTHEEIYSYYSGNRGTQGGRTYLVAARGFYIRDLLEYAGIDFNSIASIDFFTQDQKYGAYRSFTKQALLDQPRYYFPNLAANEETGEQYPYDGDNIWNGATTVEAMLALEDYTEWDVSGTEFEELYNPDMLSPNCRFHLFFGQTDPTEASTSSAAKYCYKLHITFSGKPVLTTAESNLEMKVGSAHKIEIGVDAEDGLLNDYVRNNIQWSSSDDSIVSVAEDGTLTVNGTGDAQITASFGDSSVSVNVHVADDETPPEEQAAPVVNPDDGSGDGSGTGGNGSGSGSGGANGSSGRASAGNASNGNSSLSALNRPNQTQSNTALNNTAALDKDAQVVQVPKKAMYRLSPELLAGQKPGDPDVEEASGGEMEDDSEQLVLNPEEKPDRAPLVGGGFCGAFLGGFMYERFRFRRLLQEKKV
ncbi:MAG: hypothetical protein IKD85_06180 [Firmicutes bacterium]|nr:hypothetical protein [Bacillota bacterium]